MQTMEEEDTSEENMNQELDINDKSPAMLQAIYKDLAKINGKINRMTTNELIEKLKFYHLDTGGNDDVKRRRLKNNYKRIKIASADLYLCSNLLPFYVIVDFEATCEETNPPDYKHEIIEFPAVIVSSQTQEIVDTFQKYCKPVINPVLSNFCVELTGISQDVVDSAGSFEDAFAAFEKWLVQNELGTKYRYAIVTDGPWDMSRFLHGQCQISKIPYPKWGKNWINLRKSFSNFYKCKRFCLKLMLEHIDMSFEGRPHCGLDDAKNIARILIRMICDGANIQVNERILHRPNKNNNEKTEKTEECKTEQSNLNGSESSGIINQMRNLKLDARVACIHCKDSTRTYDKIKRERGAAEAKIAKQILQESNNKAEGSHQTSSTNRDPYDWTTVKKHSKHKRGRKNKN